MYAVIGIVQSLLQQGLKWLGVRVEFSKLEHVPLEERLIFKLEEDYGLVFIHESVIELLKKHVKDVWVRDV
ncbi:hypothetical protein VITU102760_25625 [Vibrio tubiashii]|uniref:Uncharacterized protein n=1 Tax=Vibrio tubiashii ATCC 19109 TaxID=1051646 RepID=F9TDX1_9VIBR|nr:hypothetical protein [Vibrio tubiashii]AIW13569.1 hypothetical protein IX91_05040 [Vibrio tubiashii ATCC 19109]EGU46484.1 hypothetical protein VITU9109_20994 [Vibrio tubiashii ATCC 19109]EIF01889.1 hypothetical protein VT1337_21217 [Vibrio tubiashii NCIMB 1337 = ATCC 19106]